MQVKVLPRRVSVTLVVLGLNVLILAEYGPFCIVVPDLWLIRCTQLASAS